ncbi:MAG: hypothetical protein HFJ53_00395 [Clostridia bacterium]|jgi:hypothetical protein|nr:hypothetical protein [Clostridia bacterium]
MEKIKMKLWKKILIVIIILLAIFSIMISRKVIILANLDKKVTDCENNNDNIYIKATFDFNNYKSEMERYIYNDVDKIILEKIDSDGRKTKIIQIIYPNERKNYIQVEDNKIMNVYKESAPVRGSHIENKHSSSYSVIMNFTYNTNILERILSALVTKIKTIEIDGIKCYELSNLFNSKFLYSQNAIGLKIYINKETGLPVKAVELVNNNGNERKNITTYEYKFNKVTKEDVEEPNEAEYKLQ